MPGESCFHVARGSLAAPRSRCSIFSPSVRRSILLNPCSVSGSEIQETTRLERLAAGKDQQAARQGGARSLSLEGWSLTARLARGIADPVTSCCHFRDCPMMMPSKLLKSCATPPARLPIASIFCACRSCSSTPLGLGHVLDHTDQILHLAVMVAHRDPVRRDQRACRCAASRSYARARRNSTRAPSNCRSCSSMTSANSLSKISCGVLPIICSRGRPHNSSDGLVDQDIAQASGHSSPGSPPIYCR